MAPSAEHYPVVGGALLWTLEKGLGEAWTPEVAAAWTAAYGTLVRLHDFRGLWPPRKPPSEVVS